MLELHELQHHANYKSRSCVVENSLKREINETTRVGTTRAETTRLGTARIGST